MKAESTLEIRMLIVDPDEAFGDALKSSFKDLDLPPSEIHPAPAWGSSLRECQRFLSDRDFTYNAVFINPKVGHPSWVACIKSAHQFRPGVPCFVLFVDPPKMTAQQFKQLGVKGFIPLPVDYSELCDYVTGAKQAPPVPNGVVPTAATAAIAPAGGEKTQAAKRPQFTENDFVAIDIKERIGKTNALFDLFVRLSDGRFVQVLKAGDSLTQDRLDKYKDGGASHLYIPKGQHREYLEFCDQIVSQFLRDPGTPIEKKVTEISRYGAESLDFLKSAGFQTPNLVRAEKFVFRVTEGVAQIALNSPAVKTWMENAAMLEHSVGVATIAGLLLKHIGVIKPETYQAVGLAAFLHDLGLMGMPPECLDEDEEKMNPEQKALFYKHPGIGARKLATDSHPPPPGVIKAIEQHHLRINGGFPAVKGVLDLSPIAEIIGLSEEFCRLLKLAKQDYNVNPLEKIKEQATGRFSPAIVRGLMATLKEK